MPNGHFLRQEQEAREVGGLGRMMLLLLQSRNHWQSQVPKMDLISRYIIENSSLYLLHPIPHRSLNGSLILRQFFHLEKKPA